MPQFNDFSWNTQISIKSAAHDPLRDDLIALDLYELHPLPGNQVLFRGRRTHKSAIIQQTAVAILPWLQRFRTVDRHIDEIINHFPELRKNTADVRTLIGAFKRAGIMITGNEILRDIDLGGSRERSVESGRVNVFVITCDRPKVLTRLLHSCPVLDQEMFSWTIIDDSRDKTNATLNREITNNSQQPIRYFGPDEQNEFRLNLFANLPHAKGAIEFLLRGDIGDTRGTYGRSRNFALLLSPNERMIVLDDDILCQAYKPPYRTDGVGFSSLSREVDFYIRNSDWDQFQCNDTNPIIEHAKYLGHSISQAFEKFDGSLEEELSLLSDASVADLLPLSNTSKIMCTLNGSYGDPGTASIDWVFSLNSESSKRLVESMNNSSTGLPERNCWIGRNKPTLMNKFSMLSQVTGLDHTTALPPYYPSGRNEDFLFGEMLQYMYPRSVALDLALATPHLPVPERTWNSNLFSSPANPGMNHFLAGTISELAFGNINSETPELGIESLSTHFRQLGELSLDTLSELICNQIAAARTSYLEIIDKKVRSHAFNTQSKSIISKITETNSNSLSNISANDMADLKQTIQSKDVSSFVRQSCSEFGNALIHWPEIVNELKT